MASIYRHPNSRYWYCCINIPGEGQLQRTTKQTDRRKAFEFAQKLENAARGNILTEVQARKILAEIYEIRNPGEKLPGSTAKDFFQSWAANKDRETADATAAKYRNVVDRFVNSLGKKASSDISAVSRRDLIAFRDDFLANGLSAATANQAITILRTALKEAQGSGLVGSNAALGVRPVKSEKDRARRRPFTLPELRRILSKAHGEWRGLILFGLYTGQRLGDIAGLTWQNVDLERRELAFVTRKTSRRQLLPIAEPLQNFLESLEAGDIPSAPLFPKASSAKRVSNLCNQFYDLLADAGLVPVRTRKARGVGRDRRRSFNELSFHALRHTATSLMKNAGIPAAIVQDVIGHESSAISAHYTHIDEDSKRRAIESLPDLTR